MRFIVKGSYFCSSAIPSPGMIEVCKFFSTEDKANKFFDAIRAREKGRAEIVEHKLSDPVTVNLI